MPYDFEKIKIIQSFGRHIWNDIITLYDLYEEQINLKNEIEKYYDLTKPRTKNNKKEEGLTYASVSELLKRRLRTFNSFQSKIMPLKPT